MRSAKTSFGLVMAAAAFAAGVGSPTVRGDTPMQLNLAATFAPIKADLTAGQQANIVIFGDSLSVNAEPFHSTYSIYLQSILQGQYGNGGLGYMPFVPAGNAGMYSGSWTYGGGNGIDTYPYNALDGNWIQPDSGYGYFTPESSKISVQYVDQPGGGSMNLYLANSSGTHIPLATFNTASTNGATTVNTIDLNLNVAGAIDSKVYMHPGGNGPVTMLGMTDITSAPGIRFNIAAHGGWSTGDFVERNTTYDQSLKILNPQLVFIMLGQNDQNVPNTAAQFEANIQSIVTRIEGDLPNSKICLISSYNQGGAILGDYAAAEAQVAQHDSLGFINLYAAGGPYSTYVDNNYLVDGIHSNTAGGQYVGNILGQAFITNGTSLVPEPPSLGILLPGLLLFPLIRRRKTRLEILVPSARGNNNTTATSKLSGFPGAMFQDGAGELLAREGGESGTA